jgi:sec-independent protein translocase protein TatA
MGLLEPSHIILIVLALLLFFGGRKIPELMKGLGRGMKEFKDAQNGESSSTTTNSSNPTNTNTTNTTNGDKPRV